MSDPVILALVAILLLSLAALIARQAAVPSWRGARQSIQPPPVSPVPANRGRPVAMGVGIPGLSSPPRGAQRPAGSPRVIRGSDYLWNGRFSNSKSYRDGLHGEDLVVQQLKEQLDGRWTIFRNLDLPDKAGDIDIALVGPGGVLALEVKTYTGRLRIKNGHYYKETRSGHMARMQRGPGAQARTNADRLCNYLKKHGVVYWNSAEPIVVLAGDALVEIISSGTEIWTLENITLHLTRLRSHKRLSQNHIEEIVRKLEAIPSNATNTLH